MSVFDPIIYSEIYFLNYMTFFYKRLNESVRSLICLKNIKKALTSSLSRRDETFQLFDPVEDDCYAA